MHNCFLHIMSPEPCQVLPGVTLRLCWKRSQTPKFQCLVLDGGQTPGWYEAEALTSLGACTTPNISEQHSGAGASFLSQILGERAGEILFVPKSLSGYFAAGGTPRQGLAAYAQNGAGTAGAGIDGYNAQLTGHVAATLGTNCGMSTGRNGVIEILNDQGGDSLNVEKGGV